MKIDVLSLTGQSSEDEEFQMAPMIDIVFLLLIYFMVTTTFMKMEADLGIQLPGMVKQGKALKMPDEQIIEIDAQNRVILNGRIFGKPESRQLPELVSTLTRFKAASDATNNPAMITIQASDESTHQRVIDVMDACAAANIVYVTFGLAG